MATPIVPLGNTPQFEPLTLHMLATYRVVRLLLLALGIALPVLLWGGGKFAGVPLQNSMSQYYHVDADFRASDAVRELVRKANTPDAPPLTEAERNQVNAVFRAGVGPLRNVFVGALFLIGGLLIAYRGYLPGENRMLNLAGVAAIGVALLPMPWGLERTWFDQKLTGVFNALWFFDVPSMHYVSAIALFAALAWVCFFCASGTLKAAVDAGTLSETQCRWFTHLYRWCAVFMLLGPGISLWLSHLPPARNTGIFWAEALGVLAFTAYWGLKSWELHTSKVDEMAATGQVALERTGPKSKSRRVVYRGAPRR